jgi:hypothetical protein
VCNSPRNGSLPLTEEQGWNVKYSAYYTWKIIQGILYVNFITHESMMVFLCRLTAVSVYAEVPSLWAYCIKNVQ